MNKNPSFLKPKDALTETQRKSLGLKKCAPRERLPGEAPPRVYVNSAMSGRYVGTDLTTPPARPGAMDAYQIKTIGIEGT